MADSESHADFAESKSLMPSRRVGSLRQALLDTRVRAHNEVAQEMREIGRDLRSKHKAVVSDWTHQPDFAANTTMEPHLLSVDIKVRGQHKKIWRYVDEGTRPHLIMPKKAGGRLVFQLGYSPRTTPIANAHVGTGMASGAWRSPQMVNHPGTVARQFGTEIAKLYTPEFRRRIENAFRRANRR